MIIIVGGKAYFTRTNTNVRFPVKVKLDVTLQKQISST